MAAAVAAHTTCVQAVAPAAAVQVAAERQEAPVLLAQPTLAVVVARVMAERLLTTVAMAALVWLLFQFLPQDILAL